MNTRNVLIGITHLLCWLAAQNVGIGTNTPHNSALLELQSTERGILIPRMTTTQRDAIVGPALSVLIFNTTTGCFEYYNGTRWVVLGRCTNGCVPFSGGPVTLPATNITATSFTANWQGLPGATGYFLDVATDAAFTNFVAGYNNLSVGNVTSYNISGLTCGRTYYYRLRAVSSCDLSENGNVFSATTLSCPVCAALGGNGNEYAFGSSSMIRTNDGGYIMVGQTTSFGAGGTDIYVVKMDASANIQWTRVIGGAGDDRGFAIIQTTDGGYAIAGDGNSYGAGNYDMYVIKLDVSGNLQWMRTIGGAANDGAQAIIQTNDGGYAVAGYTDFGNNLKSFYVARLDANGNLSWSRYIEGGEYEWAYSIAQTTDGGFVVAGIKGDGNATFNLYITKLDASGNFLWGREIGTTNDDRASYVTPTSNGGCIVVGFVQPNPGQYRAYLAHLSSNGNLVWDRTVHFSNSDFGSYIVRTSDGGYALVGNDKFFKLDANGNPQWGRSLGGGRLTSVVEVGTGQGYTVAGYRSGFGPSGDNFYVAFLDGTGDNICCASAINPQSSSPNYTPSSVGSAGAPPSSVSSPNPSINTGGTRALQCP